MAAVIQNRFFVFFFFFYTDFYARTRVRPLRVDRVWANRRIPDKVVRVFRKTPGRVGLTGCCVNVRRLFYDDSFTTPLQ